MPIIRISSFRFRQVLYAVAAVLCFAIIGAPAWAQFETRAINPFPEGAFSIATGDFNHDGKLDVVMTTDNGFSVALGNGDGTFQKAVTYTTQLSYSLAVADFDGDGNLDIVVANLVPSTVSVYLGNGDGTFQTPVDSNTTLGSYLVVVGDFNNDKKPDLAISDPPYISVLLGNGDGTFQVPSDNDSFIGANSIAVSDFNNDHKLDVIVVGSFGSSVDMGVLLGNGDGTLQASLTSPLAYYTDAVAVGDLNGDGNADAVVEDEYGGVTVFLGEGNGSFQPGTVYYTTGFSGGPIIVSDLNRDGKLDLAIQSGPSAGMDVFWGNGDGTFQPAQPFVSGPASGLPAVGDLNGDHLPDLVLATRLYGAITMLNTGVASFSPSSPLVFRAQLINTKSAPQVVAFKNNGTTSLSIRSITASEGFQVSDTCGSSVVAGAQCMIKAVFEPTSGGAHAGLITIMDSASSKPQFISLSGNGTVIKVSPSSLNFGDVKVGSKSPPHFVTLTNQGNTTITFASIYMSGTNKKDFTQSDTCLRRPLLAGASCTATVTFAPSGLVDESAQLNFSLQNAVDPLAVALSGEGD